ncbi:MAG: hypothetical protein NXH75_02890 [Halobacteriovoraceae bacterium]|nr:hypothetical protein [Halobacteriovoraceae bacterium]
MKHLILLSLFVLSFTTFGRAPAVEPVRGISIEQYQETNPATDPGFNWKEENYVQETSLITTRVPAEAALINNTSNQSKSWPTYLFLVSLLTLPFVLWYSVMKGLESPETDPSESISSSENVASTYNLSEERKKRQQSDEDDISKAS